MKTIIIVLYFCITFIALITGIIILTSYFNPCGQFHSDQCKSYTYQSKTNTCICDSDDQNIIKAAPDKKGTHAFYFFGGLFIAFSLLFMYTQRKHVKFSGTFTIQFRLAYFFLVALALFTLALIIIVLLSVYVKKINSSISMITMRYVTGSYIFLAVCSLAHAFYLFYLIHRKQKSDAKIKKRYQYDPDNSQQLVAVL